MTIQRIKELESYLSPMISTNGFNETVKVGSLKTFKAVYKELMGKEPHDLSCLTCVKRYIRESLTKIIELKEATEKNGRKK
jgi:hypothetical protein